MGWSGVKVGWERKRGQLCGDHDVDNERGTGSPQQDLCYQPTLKYRRL